METSLLLAKFWGIFMLIFSLLYTVKPGALDKMFEYIRDEKFLFIIGYVTFLLGLINVLLHNIWAADWRLIITLMGWFALLKGIGRIGFTGGISSIVTKLNTKAMRWFLLPVFGLGVYLLYIGYAGA